METTKSGSPKFKYMDTSPIHIGVRDQSFTDFIIYIFKIMKIDNAKITQYVENNLPMFYMACTSKSADNVNNYEIFEQMGDATIYKFLVYNTYRKYPQLYFNTGSVEIVARMKINLGSRDTLSKIAEQLGMWKFISASVDQLQKEKEKLLEDVFEALIGVVETIIIHDTSNSVEQIGLAHTLTFQLLSVLFEPYELPIDYNVLVDSKNKLQGIFNHYKNDLGEKPHYSHEDTMRNNKKIHVIGVWYINKAGHKVILGNGSASSKSKAEKIAASEAIETLSNKGYSIQIPLLYQDF